MRNYFILASLLQGAFADQPVHCLRESVYGTWDFHVSKEVQNVNIFDSTEVCTHRMPNRLQFINKHHAFSFAQQDVWKVNLMDDYKVEAVKCEGSATNCIAKKQIEGKWSPIYAQALLVELETGVRFVANFKYTIKDEISKDLYRDKDHQNLAKLSTESEDAFDWQCDQTMVGFVQDMPQANVLAEGDMKSMKTVCFYGKQTKRYPVEKSVDDSYNREGEIQKWSKIVSHNKTASLDLMSELKHIDKDSSNKTASKKAPKKKKSQRSNHHLEHVPSDEMDILIATVNEADVGFKMDACKHSKHHAKHCAAKENKKQNDTNHQLATTKEYGEKTEEFQKALQKAQWYATKYETAAHIPDDQVPARYDFRSIDGYDFTGAVRDQGRCGSCYTEAFNQAVEARLKLKYGRKVQQLSAQQVLNCNPMGEGCQGGWPHLNGMFFENGYMVTEECAPYKGLTKGLTCKQFEHCAPAAKVIKTRYVGGGWGEVSEKQIMKEILLGGPVSAEFHANKLFQGYANGILSEKGVMQLTEALQQVGAESLSQSLQALAADIMTQDVHKQQLAEHEKAPELSDTTMASRGFSWQNQNHSVLIVGWGYDEKTQTKYWIVRNSYGAPWGLGGDFLLKKGSNDFGMEADIVALDVALCQEQHKEKCVVELP